jgi:hypothetical protein
MLTSTMASGSTWWVGVRARLGENNLPAWGDELGISSTAVERGFLLLLRGDEGVFLVEGDEGNKSRFGCLPPLIELSPESTSTSMSGVALRFSPESDPKADANGSDMLDVDEEV